MSPWQTFANNINREAQKYKTIALPEYRIDINYDAKPIEAGRAYCRFMLVEMRLAKQIDWFKTRYPVVHSAIRFNYSGEKVIVPYLAGPGFIREFTKENLDRVIPCNHPLTPLFPFNQGDIELQAGLFSMVTEDAVTKFITAIGRFTDLLPVPELSSILDLAKPAYQSIEDLMGISGSRLELGYQQMFSEADCGGSNYLRAGYFAVILAQDGQIDNEALCVVQDNLRIGYPGKTKAFLHDSKPLEGYSYMLFRIEKRLAQDWESLKSIKALVYKAQDAAAKGQYEQVKENLIPAIRTAIFRSPDITKLDRRAMVLKIEDELREFGLESTFRQQRSLYSIMQRPLPKVDRATDIELTSLEKFLRL